MLGYKELNSCHSESVCMVLLELSKQFICVRWMTYLEQSEFPHSLLQHAANHVTVNLSEISCNFKFILTQH